ncbi:MAG: Uncharacterised protein [Methanobacteriota archaeon]|nr:MAG: Uncharacterised protein [Euryarchaeota archaeon]
MKFVLLNYADGLLERLRLLLSDGLGFLSETARNTNAD